MLHGHYWTLRNHLLGRLSPPAVAAAQPWSTRVIDARFGSVKLTGRLTGSVERQRLLVVLHGLGGSSDSSYARRAARAAEAAGLSHLRLDLRGSDLGGEDLYHAGLVSDVDLALASPELSGYSEVFVLGYSLGGHIAARYAALARDPRVRAVACICPPLDLGLSAPALDAARLSVYRAHVLRGLVEMYRALAARHPERAPGTPSEVARIRRIQDWDEVVVAPLHGFASAREYYAQMSASVVLPSVALPMLIVHSAQDPMVPRETTRQALVQLPACVETFESKLGGHVGFPANFFLGQQAELGLEPQVIAWLCSRRATN